MEGVKGDKAVRREPGRPYVPKKEVFAENSPRSPLSTHSLSRESIDLVMDEGGVETSIDQLCRNVSEMESSDQSQSGRSFPSYGEESHIDAELHHYAEGGQEVPKEVEVAQKKESEKKKSNGKINKAAVLANARTFPSPQAKKLSKMSSELSPKTKPVLDRPPSGKKIVRALKKPSSFFSPKSEEPRDGAHSGSYLLKQARELVSSGENPEKALELAMKALKAFDESPSKKPNLELVMCLHVIAAIHCSLGRYNQAIPFLERSIEIPVLDQGPNHGLAKFAGCMQLGDTIAMLGQIENSILFYIAGLEIQRRVLGEKDPRFGETCRYVAEAHVQAFQFEEAEKLCKLALDVHKEKGFPASPQEAADRRLMGLICESKGDCEAALEHYIMASMAMAANGQEADVAAVDCSIGDAYLSLARYDEAVLAYQKALSAFKSLKGENHSSVASVFVRLANLYNKIGKFKESRSYCENALRIYAKTLPGSPQEEIASGLIDISAIYESMNELEDALGLLQKALKIYNNAPPGLQSTIAGIEAQIGVLHYMRGSFFDSYESFKSSISHFRKIGEKRSALFGVALNQMGLACVQLCALKEAADLFEEARAIMEYEYGSDHPETLGIYSNLAGTYDAMGRSEDAIEILEYIVGIREEKLGTANPDVDEEKRRLTELLKEAGRVRNRKGMSLETLLVNNSEFVVKGGSKLL
ncbi:hypothetical protein NMG60_11026607 [Bertholletia excelsa]